MMKMDLKISQEIFEKYVPAFQDTGSPDTYDRMMSFIEASTDYIAVLLDSASVAVLANDTHLASCQKLCCLMAAYRAVPQLDLVLTPNGFGVVSNSNYAPASQARVESLRERLRKEVSDTEDLLLENLLTTEWKDTDVAQVRIKHLLWYPKLVRRYGITTSDKKEVYHDEFLTIQSEIWAAQMKAEKIVGEELVDALVESQRTGAKSSSPVYMTCLQIIRLLMAAILANLDNPQVVNRFHGKLLDFVQTNQDALPEYKSSAAYRANNFSNYENKKEDGTFFFG